MRSYSQPCERELRGPDHVGAEDVAVARLGLLALDELVALLVGGGRELDDLRLEALIGELLVEALAPLLGLARRVLAGAVGDGALGALHRLDVDHLGVLLAPVSPPGRASRRRRRRSRRGPVSTIAAAHAASLLRMTPPEGRVWGDRTRRAAPNIVRAVPPTHLTERLRAIEVSALCDADKTLPVATRRSGRWCPTCGWPARRLPSPPRTTTCPVFSALAEAQPGEVLVIATNGGRLAVFGELFATEAQRRGLAGVVIDGYCRDVHGLARARAARVRPRHAPALRQHRLARAAARAGPLRRRRRRARRPSCSATTTAW